MNLTRRSVLFLTCLCLLSCIALADKKERAWQTGTLLDTDSNGYTTYGNTTTVGQINDNGTYSASTGTTSWYHRSYAFVIEGEDMVYVVSHVLSWRWSKEVKLTVNGPVRYAVEKGDFYILDENNRVFKMYIYKKFLKEGATSNPAPVPQPGVTETEPPWPKLGTSGDRIFWYQPTSIIKKDGGISQIWTKWMYKDSTTGIRAEMEARKKIHASTKGYDQYAYSMHLEEYDCQARQMRYLQAADYDKSGKLLELANFSVHPWMPVAPGTVLEMTYNVACNVPK